MNMKRVHVPHTFAFLTAAFLTAVLLAVVVSSLAASAQSAAPITLPTAPGADRAVKGGLTGAAASLPGGPDRSPLEPFLILWLLPASGILCIAAAVFVDRQVVAKSKSRR